MEASRQVKKTSTGGDGWISPVKKEADGGEREGRRKGRG